MTMKHPVWRRQSAGKGVVKTERERERERKRETDREGLWTRD